MDRLPDLYQGGPIATNVLKKRYLHRDEEGELREAPRDMFERVARAIAAGDARYGEDPERTVSTFYAMMATQDFLPNTPCLANAGWPDSTGQYLACFVLPVPDSMEGVFETLKHMALIHRSGGGTGFDFSDLRPENDYVRSTTGVASGPVSFMEGYNNTTEVVKQAGIRRGANMGILRVDHPDILQFIDCKRMPCRICAEFGRNHCDHRIRNFNISVAVTDTFMEARDTDAEYDLVNPRTKLAVGKLRARAVWERIIENAHFSGEPGVFFVDRANLRDPLSGFLPAIQATNPCGEVPLRAYDACCLGSINLGRFYVERGGRGTVDFDRLRDVVGHTVHFLDNVLTVNTYPLPEVSEVVTKCRKIGLGVMGWADLLVKLRVPYASDRAIALAEEVMKYVNASAVAASETLAEKRGPFAHWKESKWAKRGDRPRRNSTVTVIAPTGSISIIAECSGGIEPLFALSIVRDQAEMKQLDNNQEFVAAARRGGWYSEAVMAAVEKTGSCRGVAGVPDDIQEIYRVSSEIEPAWHTRMQAAFQKHTEDAVSKTINLPKSATIADVAESYEQAWLNGCKGITVYRDGSRSKQVLSAGTGTPAAATPKRRNLKSVEKVDGVRERPGRTLSVETAYGTVHVTINDHPVDGEPFECFVELGKSGTEAKALTEALGRVSSLHLSTPSTEPPRKLIEFLAEQLDGIGGGSSVGFGDERVLSAPDGVAKAIRHYLRKRTTMSAEAAGGALESSSKHFEICPKCGQVSLARVSGCDLCHSCGYSGC